MITEHQPTIFGEELISAVSSVEDGPMKFNGVDAVGVARNRQAFLEKVGIQPEQTSPIDLSYAPEATFKCYRIVDKEDMGKSMLHPEEIPIADAIVTTTPEHALLLPVADCTPAIIYDPHLGVLMLSHLGRHSIEIDGAEKNVAFLIEKFESDPANLQVWLGPSVGKTTYPIRAKGGRGQHEIIVDQLLKAGIHETNIEVADVDTAQDPRYFSHSEFLQGHRDDIGDGRFAVVAMMPARSEPAS